MISATVNRVHDNLFDITFSDNCSGIEPELPVAATSEIKHFEDCLNFWIECSYENAAISDILTQFIEDVPSQPSFARLQLNGLRARVMEIMARNDECEAELTAMRAQLLEQTDTITFLQEQIRRRSSSSCDDDPNVPFRSTSNSDAGGPTPSIVPALQITPLGSDANLTARLGGVDVGLTLKVPSTTTTAEDILIPEATMVDDESPRLSASSSHSVTVADAAQNADALRALIPNSAQIRVLEDGVQEVLKWVQPHPSQAAYRASVCALIKRQVRYVLRVNAFECGLHELRCFLPDDATKLTVVLGKLRAAQWQKTMHERLSLLATQPDLCRAQAVRGMDEDYITDQEDEFPAYDHVLSKVAVANEDAAFKVDCTVDVTELSVYCNRRSDLCMLAFLEEVAALVGKNDLFKRSLLFIRAWWFYEATAIAGAAVRQYASDFCVCIMVVAIFNQFHARVESPLQALCLFLAEYSSYDGATQAITLQGIVPFRTAESSVVHLPEVHEHHLLNAVILEKYWALFNIQDAAPAQSYGQPTLVDELNDDMQRGAFLKRGHRIPGSPYHTNYAMGTMTNTAQRAYAQPTTRLERYAFNVLHPFMCANMMERLSPRRVQRIQRALAGGAALLLSILRRAPKATTEELNQALCSFFPATQQRFGQGFVRPDRIPERSPRAIPSSPMQNDPTQMLVKTDRLLQHILYSNLILEGVLSDSALLMLCTEILKEKRIQPVGEVGKMLAEVTSAPNMSQGLKEKFGGLKKFLEHYTRIFIFSSDHPFNPCVTVRTVLEALRLEVSDAGVHALIQLNKAKKGGSKRSTPMSTPDVTPPFRDIGQSTPSSTSSSARSSFGNYSMISPPLAPAMLPVNTGRESYSYGGPVVDNRRKIAAHGVSLMTPETGFRPDVDAHRRPSVPPSAPLYSPRLIVQQTTQQARAYHTANDNAAAAQAHAQAQAQAQRNLRQQYAPAPLPGNANSAYPRAFNRTYPPPNPYGTSGGGYGVPSAQGVDPRARPVAPHQQASPAMQLTQPPQPQPTFGVRAAASLPLYARSGAPPTASPQLHGDPNVGMRYAGSSASDLSSQLSSHSSGGGSTPAMAQRPLSQELGGAYTSHDVNDLFRDFGPGFTLQNYGAAHPPSNASGHLGTRGIINNPEQPSFSHAGPSQPPHPRGAPDGGPRKEGGGESQHWY